MVASTTKVEKDFILKGRKLREMSVEFERFD
jgi:hypothetical protein